MKSYNFHHSPTFGPDLATAAVNGGNCSLNAGTAIQITNAVASTETQYVLNLSGGSNVRNVTVSHSSSQGDSSPPAPLNTLIFSGVTDWAQELASRCDVETWRDRVSDYLQGAALAINPLPVEQSSALVISDWAALHSDWVKVQSDLAIVCGAISTAEEVMRIYIHDGRERAERQNGSKQKRPVTTE